jgi:hypothetical protein
MTKENRERERESESDRVIEREIKREKKGWEGWGDRRGDFESRREISRVLNWPPLYLIVWLD